MMSHQDPSLRASDADRERVVEQLREHTAAGRLTQDEFEERMAGAYAAKTFRDLGVLTQDLPVDLGTSSGVPTGVLPPRQAGTNPFQFQFGQGDPRAQLMAMRHHWRAQRIAMRQERHAMRRERFLRAHRNTFISVNVFLWGIWALVAVTGGGVQGLWPIWVTGPWALLILAAKLTGDRE